MRIIDVYDQGIKGYYCTDSYIEVQNYGAWAKCPDCGCRPLIWIFDNGAYTGCCCGVNEYDHFKIRAESLNSRYNRGDNLSESTEEILMNNWNHYCETREDLFEQQKKKFLLDDIEIW